MKLLIRVPYHHHYSGACFVVEGDIDAKAKDALLGARLATDEAERGRPFYFEGPDKHNGIARISLSIVPDDFVLGEEPEPEVVAITPTPDTDSYADGDAS